MAVIQRIPCALPSLHSLTRRCARRASPARSAPNGQHGAGPAPPRGEHRGLPARRVPGWQHDGGAQDPVRARGCLQWAWFDSTPSWKGYHGTVWASVSRELGRREAQVDIASFLALTPSSSVQHHGNHRPAGAGPARRLLRWVVGRWRLGHGSRHVRPAHLLCRPAAGRAAVKAPKCPPATCAMLLTCPNPQARWASSLSTTHST